MADFTFTDGGGTQHTVPVWATEATLNRLVEKLVGKQEKDTKELVENLKKLTNVTIPEIDEGIEDFGKQLKENTETLKDFEEAAGGMQSLIGKLGRFGGTVLDKFIGLTLVGLTTVAGTTILKINQLGQTFNSLSQTGLALQGTTAANIAQFNELGMSTENASKFMLENAQALRVLGQKTAPQVISNFLKLSDQGNNLGLSLEDAIGFYSDELALRTQLLNLGNLTVTQQSAMNQGIQNLAQDQLVYSKALGVSTDAQREFTESVMANNQMFMASTLRFSDAMNAQVLPELQSFLSGMRAMGGEAGGEIAAAVFEAANMGAVGFSDAAFGFITVLPSLSDNMQNVIKGFENGTIKGREAVMSFTNELGNLTEYEKNRVFLLARAGDQNAQMMAKAIKQFEQATARANEAGYELENVQKGFNAFNTVMAKIKGTFSSFFNNFMDGFGQTTDDVAGLMTELGNNMNNFLMQFFGLMFGVNTQGRKAIDVFQDVGRVVGEKFNKIIVKATSFIKGMIDGMEGLNFSEVVTNIGESFIDGIKNLIPWDFITKTLTYVIAGAIGLAIVKGVAMGFAQRKTMQALASVAGGGAAAASTGAGAAGVGGGLKGLAGGVSALGALPVAVIGKAALAIALLGAALVPLAYALSLLAPLVESMGKAIKSVLEGLAPIVKAFGSVIEGMGNAIKSVFEGIAAVITAVGNSIAKVINAFRGDEVGKIKAEAEATRVTTEATADAIKKLDGMSPDHVMGLAGGITAMADAFSVFADQMSPSLFSMAKQGLSNLIGADSPVTAMMNLSARANPDEIMSLAKATMALNAANAGATKLDPSITNVNNNTYNTDSVSSTVSNNIGPAGQIETATLRDVINNSTSLNESVIMQSQTTNDLLRKVIKALEDN